MIKPLILCIWAGMGLGTVAGAEKPININFARQQTWQQIKETARARGKYVFVDCYATWCAPCKQMDREVYVDPAVATLMNEGFISVGVQMDSTENDDAAVQAWRGSAADFQKEFHIKAFPTFLFFSPEGQLVHEDVGFKSPTEFIRMAEAARGRTSDSLLTMVADYGQGKVNPNELGRMAIYTKNVLKKRQLADRMAREFSQRILENQSDEVLGTRSNLEFIGEFYPLLRSSDRMFSFLYRVPEKANAILSKRTNWAWELVEFSVSREELAERVNQADEASDRSVNWDAKEALISHKYPKLAAHKLVLRFEQKYYRSIAINWQRWMAAKDAYLKKYPPTEEQADLEFNTSGAWEAFLHCSDPVVLEKAVEWIDCALDLLPPGASDIRKAGLLDTKGNLLHKLGRTPEAIDWEKTAVQLNFRANDMQLALDRMLHGIATWPPTEEEAADELMRQEIYPQVEPLKLAGGSPDWDKLETGLKVNPALARRTIDLTKLYFYNRREPALFATALFRYATAYQDHTNCETLNQNARQLATYSLNSVELQAAVSWSKAAIEQGYNKEPYEATLQALLKKLKELE